MAQEKSPDLMKFYRETLNLRTGETTDENTRDH